MNHNIQYLNWTFGPNQIRDGNLYLVTSLLNSSLEVNVLSATVECDDRSILDFERNTPLSYYTQPDRPMIFRVQSIKRAGPETYSISATSTLGLLSEGQHYGGIYTGQTAREVIADICGTVPFIIKSNLEGIKLYGWLPIASPRDNLAQVLFAIGAALKTDLDGVLRIEGLWDGISGTVTRNDMYTEAAVEYDGKVTQVIVSEHQFVPWTEEKQLFEGTAQVGDIITFDEPMHSLKADGFTIQASGANWARVSAGSGVLSGKTYLHNTRQISKDVWPAKEPNVKTVKEATLVSLVNSQACAQRMADYYRCRERVDAPVVYHGELPGDRLATYHPFDKTGVAACLESADITLSNTLKAQEKSLVGFVPRNEVQTISINKRVVLEGNGYFEVPIGVNRLIFVIIGGAQGGMCGEKGGDASDNYKFGLLANHGFTIQEVSYAFNGYYPQPFNKDESIPCKGGKGGRPGKGGKVYYGLMENLSGGEIIKYKCGIGSNGVKYGNSSEAALGTDSTFGDFSSADGTYYPYGYKDLVTDDVYAHDGANGISGGDAAYNPYNLSENVLNMGKFLKATDVIDEDGVLWHGGETETTTEEGVEKCKIEYATVRVPGSSKSIMGALSSVALGGGAAAGCHGINGSKKVGSYGASTYSISSSQVPGIDGADALKRPKKKRFGIGGSGGYGGGGGSARGYNSIFRGMYQTDYGDILSVNQYWGQNDSVHVGIGGKGSDGGDGGDGVVIVYYSEVKEVHTGQLVDKNGKMVLDRLGRRIIM